MKRIIVAFSLLWMLSACVALQDAASVPPPAETILPPSTPTPELQTSASDTPPAPTAIPELPISCRNPTQDTLLYISHNADYCFRYPLHFDSYYSYETRETHVVGPFLFLNDGSPVPLYASMWISSSPGATGQTLTQAVDAIIWRDMASITDTQRPIDPTLIASAPFTRTITTIGGEPAEIVDGLSGIMSTRQAFIIHKNQLFTLGVSPNPDFEPLFVEVQPDARVVWETVMATFAFLR